MTKEILHLETIKLFKSSESVGLYIPKKAKEIMSLNTEETMTLRIEKGNKGIFLSLFTKKEK